ncbi:hypothetical protein VPH35_036234 [Triticum aestivum]
MGHVHVSVIAADEGRYRNEKQAISTNILGVVDWNMNFLYVLPSWEGSTSESQVLRDAMRNDHQDAFVIPHGKYYLVDAGYTNGPSFLAPFRSTRYSYVSVVSIIFYCSMPILFNFHIFFGNFLYYFWKLTY